MKEIRKTFTPLVISLTLVMTIGLTLQACAYEDDDDDDEGFSRFLPARMDFRPADDPQYREECGACHLAYPPGMLPARSWQRIMSGLEDHFGENAELDAQTTRHITEYLTANAADRGLTGRAANIARSLGLDAPLRFTETRYFLRKHHEIPPRLVVNNPDVGSFSRCEACHTGAERGNYDEHQVRIPGVGRWDD